MMITAELKNWHYDPFYKVYWGRIYNDVKNRFSDGKIIHTSSVVRVDKSNPEVIIVHTLNSVYLLRKENERGGDGTGSREVLDP